MTSPLKLEPNLADPDAVYAQLIAEIRDLPTLESEAFMARLILILMNHIGDKTVIFEALEAARTADPSVNHPKP